MDWNSDISMGFKLLMPWIVIFGLLAMTAI